MRLTGSLALVACLLVGVACDSDGVDVEEAFDLTFTGDASFQGAHGGQAIEVALVTADGTVTETAEGTVAAGAAPAFSFEFPAALTPGQAYELHYWIDSNFGGGTPGACDPPSTDHQWSIAIPPVSDDVVIADVHRPAETTSVCDSF